MKTIKTILVVAFVAAFALSFQSCSTVNSIGSDIGVALGGDTGYFSSEIDLDNPKYVKKTIRGSDGRLYIINSVEYPRKKYTSTQVNILKVAETPANRGFSSMNR